MRQILNWLFDKKEEDKKPRSIRVVLFVMLCILLMPLIIGTTIASWKASPDLVTYTTPVAITKDLDQLASELDSTTQVLLIDIDKDRSRDSILFEKSIQAEKEKWEAKIEEAEIKERRYRKLYANGHSWAGGSAAKIKNEILPKIKSDMASSIMTLHTQSKLFADSLIQVKNALLFQRQQEKATLLANQKIQNEEQLFKTETNIEKWSNFLAILAIIATFFTLFCFTFIEAYKAGVLKETSEEDDPDVSHPPTPLRAATINTQKILDEILVPQSTPQLVNNNQITQIDFVSLDKLIKRTRMQWKRSKVGNTEESRGENLKKAKENIAFLKAIGIQVEVDKEQPTKLVIQRREIA